MSKYVINKFLCYWCGAKLKTYEDGAPNWTCPKCKKFALKIGDKNNDRKK